MMKKIILILAILISNGLHSQHDFRVEWEQIIWEHTFETDNIDNLQNHLTNTEFTSNLIIINNKAGEAISTDYKGYMGRNLPFHILNGFKSAIRIDIFENNYTVKITHIKFLEYSMGGTTIINYPIEWLILKHDNTFKKRKRILNLLDSLNEFFLKTFSINTP